MRKAFVLTVILGFAIAMCGALYACSEDNGDVGSSTPVDAAAPVKRDAAHVDASDAEASDADPDADSDGDVPDDAMVDAGVDGADDDASVAFLYDAGTFTVVRVGEPSGAVLTTAAAPVYLEDRLLSDGGITRTVAMPNVVDGVQRPFTLRGTGATEGALSLSTDGAYLAIAGYTALPGAVDPSKDTAAVTPRVVARISKIRAVDTSSVLDTAFDQSSPRGAASADGSGFWLSGDSANTAGGVYYLPFGTTGGTQVLATPVNLRTVGLFGGQLYASTESGTMRIFSIGAGMPTTAGQTATELDGVTSLNTTSHGFVLLDLDAVAGVETMYVANTASVATTGGVQKWKLAAGTWTLVTTFKSGLLTLGPINLTAKVIGTTVVVLAVTQDNPARVVRFLDDGVNLNPSGIAIGTSTAGKSFFRGIALSPP